MDTIVTGMYKHYKGNFYEVVGTARFSEDITTEYVIYKQLYDSVSQEGITLPAGTMWARPKEMFAEMVEINGIGVKRFARVISQIYVFR